jgi:hypothetical protein
MESESENSCFRISASCRVKCGALREAKMGGHSQCGSIVVARQAVPAGGRAVGCLGRAVKPRANKALEATPQTFAASSCSSSGALQLQRYA